MALEANDEITKKSGSRTLDDKTSSASDSNFSDVDVGKAGSDERTSILNLTDGEGSEGGVVKSGDKGKKKKGDSKPDKSLVTIKGFRVNNPLETKCPRVNAATAQANKAITAIGSYFNPDQVRDRNESRTTQSFHFSQLQSTQLELREVRTKNESLQDKLYEQTRRADKLENKYEMLKERYDELKEHSRRRRRSYSDSQSPRHNKRACKYSPSTSPHSSYYEKAPVASSSKYLDSDPPIPVKMTLKRNRAGYVQSFKITPSTQVMDM